MQQYFVDQETAQWLVRYHNFISFNLYVIGFCGFVLSLKHGHYQFQFTQVFIIACIQEPLFTLASCLGL